MLRLYDDRTGRVEPLPPGRALRVHVLDGAGARALVVTDLLRRVAGRAGHRVRATASPSVAAQDTDWSDFNIQPFEAPGPDRPGGSGRPVPDADVYVSESGGAEVDGLRLTVPRESGDWSSVLAESTVDPLYARLAMLEGHYREPLYLPAAKLAAAAGRLDEWRDRVARWATEPGRPMSRPYTEKAEAALADDLGSPGALAVLDELADDPDVSPGAKLDTIIHLDLILGLNLVAAIGRA